MFIDCDGVVNFDGSRSKHNKLNGLGYLRRASIVIPSDSNYGPTHNIYNLNWSAEMLRKLSSMNADWIWLTTWNDHTDKLNIALDLNASTSTLDWDISHGAITTGGGGWSTSTVTLDSTHPGKYLALRDFVNANPRPFVWLDDTATVYFNPDDFTVPSLVLATDPDLGVTKDDLDKVSAFVATYGG